MDRLLSALALPTVLAILISTSAAFATKVYTTDTQELPLRATPSRSGKTLLMVPPASAVELVYSNSYTKVRYETPDGEKHEGWIPLRFLSPQPPDSSMTRELGAENETLKKRLGELDKEKTALSHNEEELTDKLTKLNAAYHGLEEGSANYLKLKSENDFLKTSLASAQEKIGTLIQENDNLKLSHKAQWFVPGVLILFSGWFMGWAWGRWRKRRRRTYYY